MNSIHLDDLAAMAESCWAAFLSPEQESVLIELLKLREAPNDRAFEREFCTLPEEEPCSEE